MPQKIAHGEKATLSDLITVSGVAVFCLLLTWLVYLSPRQDEPVAVVSAPWQHRSAAEIVARAGGYLVSSSYSGALIIARSDDPAFSRNLSAQGALFVFNPRLLAGCGVKPS